MCEIECECVTESRIRRQKEKEKEKEKDKDKERKREREILKVPASRMCVDTAEAWGASRTLRCRPHVLQAPCTPSRTESSRGRPRSLRADCASPPALLWTGGRLTLILLLCVG